MTHGWYVKLILVVVRMVRMVRGTPSTTLRIAITGFKQCWRLLPLNGRFCSAKPTFYFRQMIWGFPKRLLYHPLTTSAKCMKTSKGIIKAIGSSCYDGLINKRLLSKYFIISFAYIKYIL